MMKRLMLLAAVCASIPMLRAQTVKTVPGMYTSIAAAIAAASSGDTISIAAGRFDEQLRIAKTLTLIGAGRDVTMIHDAANSPDSTALFIDNASVVLRNIQFVGGSDKDGGRRGVVAVNSTTVIRQCAFVAFFNVSIADVNGSMDIDSVVITGINNFGSVLVDSAGPAQTYYQGCDLGVMLVDSHFSINHLTGGARIDHIIDIYPDLHGDTFLGPEYPVDTTHFSEGTIQNSTFFGSRESYYGQGMRIFGAMNRLPSNLVIRYNRFKGTVTDSTLAVPNMPTTAGISFNGWNGYAEIYDNTITLFNSGIAFHGVATASMHDNTITGNARYGVTLTDGAPLGTSPDLGGGAFSSPGRNTIMNNGHYNVYNQNTAVHYAKGNYWGTTDPAAIDASIYDDNEGGSGLVHFENYLSASGALPVELASFTIERVNDHQVVLHWKTATEVNNAGFDVERASTGARDGMQRWLSLGFVPGFGSSNAPHDYRFADATLSSGGYLYRLKQIDRDGRFEYSGSLETEAGNVPNVFELSQNYPNPFNPATTLSFMVPSDGRARLTVYNTLGQTIATVVDGFVQTGSVHRVLFDASSLPSGVYLARLEFNGKQMTRKVALMK
jgi:Secretion system C-terminal sorting domain/Right handed beta helix region